MKTMQPTTLIAASLLLACSAFARGGPGGPGGPGGGNGRGYGGPPASEEERAARQTKRQKANDGECDGSGQQTRQRQRRGAGNGQGNGGNGGNRPAGN